MLLQKGIRLLKKILSRILIWKKQYKPTGAYPSLDTFAEAVTGAKVIDVFPTYVSHLNVSSDFKSHFVSYIPITLIAQIPAAKVAVIPNGRVYTDNNFSVAIISGNNKLIGDLSFDISHANPAKNSIFKQNYFHSPTIYSGVVCSLLIGEGGIVNYSHWLIDSLSKLELIKRSGWYDKIDWFLVPSTQFDFQRDSLHMLGVDEKKIISAAKKNHIQASILLATTHVRYAEHIPEWCCQFLRNEFLEYRMIPLQRAIKFSRYVYISRNDSAKRHVLNEDQLMNRLAAYGFVSYELANLSFHEKIALFAQANIVIAPLGAGQANLVFCKEKTNVIELMADDFAQPFFNDLANKAGLYYNYLICKSDGHAKTFKQGEKLNLIVDIDEVERKLQTILQKK